MYRFDTHVHTSEISPCGNVSAQDTIRLYRDAGFSGVCITDHFFDVYFNSLNNLTWKDAVNRFLLGYHNAKETGNRLGVDVLLGAEIRLTNSLNDYLLFGLNENFLYKHPHFYKLTIEELYDLTSASGILIFQAHPFRPNLSRENPRYIDGVEVVNGNIRHNSHNDLALAFAQENDLAISAGSDCHEIYDVGKSGIITSSRISSEDELKAILMNRTLKLIEIEPS